MSTPTLYTNMHNLGRTARITAFANWTQSESDNLTSTILARLEDLTSPANERRFAVESVEWNCSDGVIVTIDFDSMPPGPDGFIVEIPWGNSSGRKDFDEFGCLSDPNRLSPGNIVINTRNALPDDNLSLTMIVKIKGRHNVS